MAEAFRRPSHQRVTGLLQRMDGAFLAEAACYFGGGTQLVLAHGEYRESLDIDFLVSSREGFRRIRETIGATSLGALFHKPIVLAREVMADRDAVRTFIAEDAAWAGKPVKLEVLFEGRIDLRGEMAPSLGVPVLHPADAMAEKFLANADRGADFVFRSRDVIDLAFAATRLDEAVLREALKLAQSVYGKTVLRALETVLQRLERDAEYRRACVADLLIDDEKRMRQGLSALRDFATAQKKARRKTC